MVLDIFVVIVIIVAAVLGYRQGFAKTLSHFGGWLISILMGILFFDNVRDLLVEHTDLDEFFYKNIYTSLAQKSAETVNDTMPSLIRDSANAAGNSVASASAMGLTTIIMSIFAFLVIVLGIKIITWVFMHIFSKKHRKGMVGGIDGVLGIFMGIIKGVLIVVLVFALVVPLLNSAFPDFAKFFQESYKSAIIAPYFYDYNALLELMKKIFS